MLLQALSVTQLSLAKSLKISPSVFYFDYEEFNTSGFSLNRETGFLPGLKLKLNTLHGNNELNYSLSFYNGNVDYNGSTQSGQAHTTTTDTQLFDIGLSYQFTSLDNKPFFGFRHWRWNRDILDNNNVRGLHEIYNWNELNFGLTFETSTYQNLIVWAKPSLLYVFNPRMKILLPNSNLTLNMKDSAGARLHAGITWPKNKSTSYSLSIISEYWEFGRSNTEFTDDFFGNSVFVTEPRSESFHNSIQFDFINNF